MDMTEYNARFERLTRSERFMRYAMPIEWLRTYAQELIAGTRTEKTVPQYGRTLLDMLGLLEEHEEVIADHEKQMVTFDEQIDSIIDRQRDMIEELTEANEDLHAKLYLYERKHGAVGDPRQDEGEARTRRLDALRLSYETQLGLVIEAFQDTLHGELDAQLARCGAAGAPDPTLHEVVAALRAVIDDFAAEESTDASTPAP